jgi:ATP-dependent Clp protease protease subunit
VSQPGGERTARPPIACVTMSEPRPELLPLVTAQNQPVGDMRAFDVYTRLMRERIVFLGTQVDDNIANLICAQLLLLDSEDKDRDIFLYINSPGGSVTSGLAIYDTMQYIQSDVATVCMGLAASMGQFLLCAGAPGKRFALPHSRILMHQPSGGVQGQAADIAIQAEQIIYLKRMMAERIAFHTGQSVERIEEDSDRDRWFTADEAKDYGIIDEVIDRARRLAEVTD